MLSCPVCGISSGFGESIRGEDKTISPLRTRSRYCGHHLNPPTNRNRKISDNRHSELPRSKLRGIKPVHSAAFAKCERLTFRILLTASRE